MEEHLLPSRYHKSKLEYITSQYGLRLRRIQTFDSLYKKNAVIRASTNKGKYLIKALSIRTYGKNLTKKQLSARFFSHVRKLKKYSYPNCANWLTTKSGQYFVNKNGSPYYMTEWIKGRSLQNDVLDYEALGKALANLHILCKDDERPSLSFFTKKQIKIFEIQDRLFRLRLKGIRQRKSVAKRWFKNHGDQCINLANEAWDIIKTSEVKRVLSKERNHPALIHGDVTTPNIVINSSGLYLIDWDCLRMGSIYNEIAKTLSNTTYYKPVHIDALLRSYEKIKPLHSAERLLISALYRLPREAWGVARNIAFGKGLRDFHLLKQTWDERLGAIRWLDEWARQLPPVTK
jgi:Ser/Thr protein kinase RdoA (MazF antagonist)